MRTLSPPFSSSFPSPPARPRRKGAADAFPATRQGRKRKLAPCPPAAATCKRWTARASCVALQQMSAAGALLLSACCAAHSASLSRCRREWFVPAGGRTTSRRCSAIPAAAQACACRPYGGAMRSSQPSSAQSRCNAGRRRAISPWPQSSQMSSVNAPRGQPPPGNSASSSGKPLFTAGSAKLAPAPDRWPPRQRSGRESTSLKETAFIFKAASRGRSFDTGQCG